MRITPPSTTDLDAFLCDALRKEYDRVKFNCWDLFALAQRQLYGRQECLPEGRVRIPADREGALAQGVERWGWREVPRVGDGDAVLMSRAPGGPREHVGVYIAARRRVLHADSWHGVVLDEMGDIRHVRLWHPRFYRPTT